MGVQTCDPVYRYVGGLVNWAKSYVPWTAEKVRKTPKGPQGTGDKRRLKECEGQGNERSTSCQQTKLFGDRCGDSNEHSVGEDSLMNVWIWIYTVRLVNVFSGIFWGVLQKNLHWYQSLKETEKRENENHPPLKMLKGGKQRYVLKNGSYGAQRHHSTESRNHKLVVFLLTLLSKSGCGTAASVPNTRMALVTKPSMTKTLPPSTTGETWLYRNEVESMISKRSFNGSFRGYTNISLNAFNGFAIAEIFLSGNYLTVLPDDLFQNVHGLQRVYLDHNLFTLLPVALNNCPDLVFFDISYNDVKEIPRHSISKATRLLSFDVSGNRNLGNYPDDAFSLPKLSIVYLKNTSINSLPFPPPSSEFHGKYSFKCDAYIVTLVKETGETKFDLQNTDALSSENWAVIFYRDPEQRLVPFNCKDQSFGPFEAVEDRSVSTIAPFLYTNLNVSLNSNETDSSIVRTVQNKSRAGVPLWILGVIFGICICTLYLKTKENGKNGLTHFAILRLFAVEIVVTIGTLLFAWFFFVSWEALCLLGGSVAVLAVASLYLYKLKKNKTKDNCSPPVVYKKVVASVSV